MIGRMLEILAQSEIGGNEWKGDNPRKGALFFGGITDGRPWSESSASGLHSPVGGGALGCT